MKKFAYFALFLASIQLVSAVTITGFGTGDFTVDSGTSSFTTINTTVSDVNVVGTDGAQILAGTFVPVNITGLSVISLTGFVSGVNPNSQFFVELYNTDFSQFRTYSGFLSSFASTSTTVNLTFESQTAAFNDIAGFVFTGAGSGSALNMTFDMLSATAVPEPSTYALLALGIVGLVAYRRRLA